MRMKMGPRHATALDIALDQLVPGEVRIGRPAVPEDAQVDDMPDARVGRGVGNRLGLMRHRNRVAGHHKQPIDPLQRRSERPGVIKVELNRGPALAAPQRNSLRVARGANHLDPIRGVVQVGRDRASRQAGRSKYQHTGLRALHHRVLSQVGTSNALRHRQRDRGVLVGEAYSSLQSDSTNVITQRR